MPSIFFNVWRVQQPILFRPQDVSEKAEKLLADARAALAAEKNEDAIALLSRALLALDQEEDAANEDAEDDECDTNSPLRLQIFAARSEASMNLQAYHAAIRDCDMIYRIFGSPIEVLNSLEQPETTAYFNTLLRRGQANQKIGDVYRACQNFLSIMTLKVIAEHQEEMAQDGETEMPDIKIVNDLADALVERAANALKSMEHNPYSTAIFRLKITLLGVEPPVWRTLEVTDDTSLAELREYIVYSMGWSGLPQAAEFEVYDHGIIRYVRSLL